MITLTALNQRIHQDIVDTCTLREQTVALEQALGRVLAVDMYSSIEIPADNVSAMDGYAFIAHHDGLPNGTTLQLVGESIAGQPFNGTLKQGECVRIMTGAVVPAGADSVEMQEYTQVDGQQITFMRQTKSKANIRFKGEELLKDDILLRKGQILNAADILLLASVGHAECKVNTLLTVGVLSTGDELTPPGHTINKPGQLYDSNRSMIKALLADLPVTIKDYGLISDDLASIKTTLTQAQSECDVVITSGGVSVGDYDFLRTAVSELGEIKQYKINIKPGKPFVYGKLNEAWYFGLPGNPVSGFVGFTQIIAPALWQLAGATVPPALTLRVPLSEPLTKRGDRQDFQRGYLKQDNGQWQVCPQGKQDSHRVYGLARANCFIVLDAHDKDKAIGEMVTVIPFTSRFGLGGFS